MDLQKMNEKKKFLASIIIITIVALFLYNRPLFSNKPLGLDTMGHLSKVSYLKEFGNVNWDKSWYNGGPFLKFYSPLFYYFVRLFSNLFFGSNLACFLSILLCSIGIFLIVKNYSKNYPASLLAALFFLSIINVSYYWIVVGNHPFVFALWTIPFSLFFLEKAFNRKIYLLPYSFIFLIGILSHIFIGMCISFIVFMRILFYSELKIKKITKGVAFLLIPVGLSCFWLLPFLTNSTRYVGDEVDYKLSLNLVLPFFVHLLGVGGPVFWGVGAMAIGFSFIIFILMLFFIKRNLKNRTYLYILILTIILFLLSLGILGKYYPTGIGAIRFFPVFSIFLCIFIGLSLTNLNKKFYFLAILLLVLSLYLNYNVIRINYNDYSYCCNDLKFGKFENIYEEFYNFSFINNSYDFRFGVARFPFSKSLTYVFPRISQTSGYYDQGILYETTFYKMKNGIWYENDTNKTLYYLDWFGIRYFELSGGYLDSEWKFQNSNFKLITLRNSIDYPYKIYEYKKAKPILSVIKTNLVSSENLNESEIDKMASENKNTEKIIPFISKERINISNKYSSKNFSINRRTPDFIEIDSDFDGETAILFRESYYPSWKAREYPDKNETSVYRTANDLMLIIPKNGTQKVILYQSKMPIAYFGIVISIFCLLIAVYLSFATKESTL